MSRLSIGVVEFQDIQLKTRTQIIITRIPEKNMTNIFLNQDANHRGVLGAGDVEVGIDRENTKSLLEIVQQAIHLTKRESPSWQSVGEAEFSWSDHADRSESGKDNGTVLIESNGSAARMVLQTKMWEWAPYVATFSSDNLELFATLLSHSMYES